MFEVLRVKGIVPAVAGYLHSPSGMTVCVPLRGWYMKGRDLECCVVCRVPS